jgi:hypothetical protein
LIELWHQSLARSKKSRDWTAFSNLNRGVSKKAAYTAENERLIERLWVWSICARPMRHLVMILIALLLAVRAMSVELLRYRGLGHD